MPSCAAPQTKHASPLRNSFRKTLRPQSILGILHSHPTWMVERWLARFGEERTIALLEANNRTPRLSCALHDITQREEIFSALRHAGLRIEPGNILQSAFAVSGGSPTRTESFRTGAISIQDEASQTVAASPRRANERSRARSLRRARRQIAVHSSAPQDPPASS